MSLRTPFIALALSVLAVTAAQAAHPHGTPRVDQRQAQQAQRIHQGVASGQLTARESLRLRQDQRQIQRFEHHAKADGIVTARERQRLHAMQAAASRDIRWQKHDRQQRGWR